MVVKAGLKIRRGPKNKDTLNQAVIALEGMGGESPRYSLTTTVLPGMIIITPDLRHLYRGFVFR